MRTRIQPWGGPMGVGLMAVALCALSAGLGCGPAELESRWSGSEVRIDGVGTEWEGQTTDYSDQHLAVGVRNDNEHLYAALFISDLRLQAQVLTRGLTIWFDPSGQKLKTFGIRCPAALAGDQAHEFTRTLLDGGDVDSLIDAYKVQADQVQLLGGESDAASPVPMGASGVEVAFGVCGGLLTYELEVPLAPSASNPTAAIRVQPGGSFSVGLETRGSWREGMRGAGPGGAGPGGGPGGGRGRGPSGSPPAGGPGGPPPGGPGGSGGRDGSQGAPQWLSLWAKIRLSAAPSPK